MAILPHTVEVPGGLPLTIYGETDNINYFINGDLEPDTLAEATVATVSVRSHSRRQYPGDATTISVSGGSRTFVKDPTRSKGSALPGQNFILKDGHSGSSGEMRTFTYKGRYIDLRAFIEAEAARDLRLYSSGGSKVLIAAATAP